MEALIRPGTFTVWSLKLLETYEKVFPFPKILLESLKKLSEIYEDAREDSKGSIHVDDV